MSTSSPPRDPKSQTQINSEPTERIGLEGLTRLSRAWLQAVVDELCRMLDPGKPSFTPSKGKPSVVMFVGLQGQCHHPSA